jgi:hypothetical protein
LGQHITSGALLTCSKGTAPSVLIALPIAREITVKMTGATIHTHLPFLNIQPFGKCTSLANPMVQAATLAAFGILTPVPCFPITLSPWTPTRATVLLGKISILDDQSQCECKHGGHIACAAKQTQVRV